MKLASMNAEIHLFVLWEKVGSASGRILARIQAEFEVLGVFRIQWTRALFSTNLSRFYGQSLPPGAGKEESCGTGPFLLVVVRDERPDYALRETLHGQAHVNTHCFDLKSHFRRADEGGLPLHATDTPRETRRDLMLLLGTSVDKFVLAHPGGWDGEIVPLRRDIVGARGWDSMGALFSALNETSLYVVLRNFENLPTQYRVESHGDVDLLVGDFWESTLAANATPVFRGEGLVQQRVVIGGSVVPFDFRYVGDGYYDEKWQRQILASRQMKAGVYVPDLTNYFYSLLYHAAVHKPAIASDYAKRLCAQAESLGIPLGAGTSLGDPKYTRRILREYLSKSGYRFTRPHDPSVHFNKRVALDPIQRFRDGLMPRNAPMDPDYSPAESSPESPYSRLGMDGRLSDPARANLLRPFKFSRAQRVLELGCGCGVITRFLAQSAADVVAVESNPALAVVAEEACHDLPNVRVLCSDLLEADPPGPFDVVTLVGAVTQVGTRADGMAPLDCLLQKAAALVSQSGLLIIAVDNQLGLKCFNGGREETSGIPYHGINALYGPGEAATIGRRALAEKLERHGFVFQEFYYPFPDFRLPGLILGETVFSDRRINIPDLLIHNTSREFPETYRRAFAEDLAWRAVEDNGLLADLANSFLVFAAPTGEPIERPKWMAKLYSRGSRRLCYQVESTIQADAAGRLEVRKNRLHPDQSLATGRLHQVLADAPYIEGNLLVGKIHSAMAREAAIDELSACFRPWLDFLNAHMSANDALERVLPEHFADCIPANLVEDGDGRLHYFDAEWVSDEPVPFGWVVVRGIVYSLIGCLENRAVTGLSYRAFIGHVLQGCKIQLGESDFVLADEWESSMVEQCHADAASIPRIAKILDDPVFSFSRLSSSPDVNRSLIWREAELARVKGSVSWRITAPMRVAWNLYLKFIGGNTK